MVSTATLTRYRRAGPFGSSPLERLYGAMGSGAGAAHCHIQALRPEPRCTQGALGPGSPLCCRSTNTLGGATAGRMRLGRDARLSRNQFGSIFLIPYDLRRRKYCDFVTDCTTPPTRIERAPCRWRNKQVPFHRATIPISEPSPAALSSAPSPPPRPPAPSPPPPPPETPTQATSPRPRDRSA